MWTRCAIVICLAGTLAALSATTAFASVETGTIAGKVTSASSHAGIAGIEVCAAEDIFEAELFGHCTKTGAGGEYSIAELPAGSYGVGFFAPEGSGLDYVTQYYNDKRSIDEAGYLAVEAGKTAPAVNAELAPGGQIAGKVTDAGKAPIAGISVCAYGEEGLEFYPQCATTGVDGEYAISGLATGSYAVYFSSPENSGLNYIAQYYEGTSSDGEDETVSVTAGSTASGIDVDLTAGGEIKGEVTSASSKAALSGVQVCLQTTSGEYFGECATSSSTGEYAITGLGAGEYEVEFSDNGANYVTQYYKGAALLSEAQSVPVTAGSTTSEIDEAMVVGGQITGKVTSEATKAGLQNAEACAMPVHGGASDCATTNAAGEYTIIALATGEYTVEFSASGQNYASQYYDGKTFSDEAEPVSVTVGATTSKIEAAMATGGQIAGNVTNASSKAALAGIQVCATTTSDEYTGKCASTNTAGEYTIIGLAGGEYKVEFYSNGAYFAQYYDGTPSIAEAGVVSVTAGATTPGIDAAMIEGGHIEGKVTSAATHAALGGVQVCAEYQSEYSFGWCMTTNAAGEYAFAGLSAGQYSVKFEAYGENYLPQYYDGKASSSEASLVPVTDGATASEINAALATGGQVKGEVTSAATKGAIAGIEVCAEPQGEDLSTHCAHTGATGEYTIAGLASGKYDIYFAAPSASDLNYLPQYYDGKSTSAEASAVPVTAGSTTEGIGAALATGGQIEGEVTAASSKAGLTGIEVCASPLVSGEERCTTTSATGAYTLSSLATGEYRVEFSTPYYGGLQYAEQYYDDKGSYSEADPVAVTAGAAKSGVDAAMVTKGEISGKVTGASSKAALSGVEACPMTTYGGYDGQCATTNANGEYTITGLLTGEYKVEFSVPYGSDLNYLPQYNGGKESVSEAAAISVSVGKVTGEIDAAMVSGGEIVGKVTNASSKAGLGGIEVCPQKATGESSSAQCVTSSAGGEYKLVGLAGGEYRVEFYSQTGANFVTQYYDAKLSDGEANLVSVTAGSVTPEINAAIVVGGKITGKVTDASTKDAVANIQICAQPTSGGYEQRCGTTNAGGEYTVIGLATGQYRVEFSVPYGSTLNYVSQYYEDKESSGEATPVSVTAGASTPEIDAAMVAGGRITGTVTDASTKAGLDDVYVCLQPPKSTTFGDCVDTKGSGGYAFAGLAEGEYKVEFESFDGYSTQYYDNKGSASEAEPVSVTAGATTPNIDAAMVVGAEITGTVTSAATKAGIAGVEVCAYGTYTNGIDEEGFTRCGDTGPDGEYTIDGLAVGEYRVQFNPDGQNYISQYYEEGESSSEAKSVSVAYDSTTREIDATLAVGGEISGEVTNASTKAALGGITVCPQATSGNQFSQCTTSNASGEYTLAGLRTGEYKLEFYPGDGANYVAQYYHDKSSYAEAEAVAVTAGSTTTEIDTAMVVGGQIAGKVTNASTKAAVSGIDVCSRAVSAPQFFNQCATTNASGEYTIVGLATGEYKVEFNPSGQNFLQQYYSGKASASEAEAVAVTAGSTTSKIGVAMIVGGEIAGKVVEASTKAAIADIEVCSAPVDEGELFSQCTFTNDQGEYTIVALTGGEYDVRFSSPSNGYATQYYDTKTSLAFAEPVTVVTGSPTDSIDAELANLPVSIGAPVIAGTAQQGKTLTETHGSWTNNPTGYAYQWELCNAIGGECQAISEATAQTYVPSLADVGHTLRVSETADNVAGAGSPAVSVPTAVVLPLPPVNVTPPSISGRAQQGKTLNEAHGSWENDPTEYTYQWQRCDESGEHCSAISGATKQTYVPGAEDVGHMIEVQEIAGNAGGSSQPASSTPTAVVVPPVPVETKIPTISGGDVQGKTLTEAHGSWEYSPTEYTYQWQRCDESGEHCSALAGATEQTYTLTGEDVGHTIRVQEVATNAGGSSTPAVSAPSAKIAPAVPVNVMVPSLSGTAQQGETLTEGHGEWTNEPTHYEYQWSRCDGEGKSCAAISGATEQTYLLSAADVGHTIEVSETARNAAGPSVPAGSTASAVVLPAIPVDVTPPTIGGGAARQGATLTETPGTWTNSPTGHSYQWLQCNAIGAACLPISGATGQTYVPDAEDVGHTIEVQETTGNAGGSSEPATSSASAVVLATAPSAGKSVPTIAGEVTLHQTLAVQRAEWTNEPTSYEDQWLRCDSTGANCQPISGAVNAAYVTTTADVGYTIAVREVAVNAGGPSAPVTSAATGPIVAPPLQASAGESVDATAGVPVMLDASGSSPASEITGYSWSFGDGSAGNGSVAAHVYGSPGTYTATITVHRGAESAEQHVTVAVASASTPSHSLTIKTQDAGGNPLSGVEVLYIGPSGTRIEGVSDASGAATLDGVPGGAQTVYAWAAGYQPAVGHVTVSEGGGEATVTLSSGAVATSTLKSHEMTLKEIEAAGIDTSDPANQRVFEFEIRLAFFETSEPQEPKLHCYINSEGHFVGPCVSGPGGHCTVGSCSWGWNGVGGGGGGGVGGCCGTGGGCCGVVAVPKIVEGHPLIQWLILRGKATILKQFFAVQMITQNLSPEPFKLTHGSATLNLPSGLSLAPTAKPQSLEQSVPDIPGLGSATTEWVVRGDETGEYYLSAEYKGQLEPFAAPVEIEAALASPLKVWGANALSLSVKADDSALEEGVPYHVTVAITNKAEVPLYNVDLAIDEDVHANFIFQPDQSFHDDVTELKPGQTLTSGEYILVPDAASVSKFNPSLSSATFDGEEVHPGQGIEAVPAPPVYGVKAPEDAKGEIHLEWEPVPGAEGYEVFSTPNLETAFPEQPLSVATAEGSDVTGTILPANVTGAYLSAAGGRYYAVSALIDGILTLKSRVVVGSPGDEEEYEARKWPAAGYGYRFPNRGMQEYAAKALPHLSEPQARADILRSSELADIYADWNADASPAGELKGRLSADHGKTLIEKIWEYSEDGVCYGLALSAGRFDNESESLYAPSAGRSDSAWRVGVGPSASTLLPEPQPTLPAYSEQALRLIEDDFTAQLSTEAIAAEDLQWKAYKVPSTGFTALVDQVMSVMKTGGNAYDSTGRISTATGSGFAVLMLDRVGGGHAVLAYSAEMLANGALKVDVADSNDPMVSGQPGDPQHLIVYPDGTWTYTGTYANSSEKSFPGQYSLESTGSKEGIITVVPLFDPSGLHLFPATGAVVDVGHGAQVSQAANGDGSEAFHAALPTDAQNYAGESLLFETNEGELSVSGTSAEIDVRGPGVYMAMESPDIPDGATMRDNVKQGTIESSAPATLEVARGHEDVSGVGLLMIGMHEDGAVSAKAGEDGKIAIHVNVEDEGEDREASLYEGTVDTGEELVFSQEEVARAEAAAKESGSGGEPAGGGPSVGEPTGGSSEGGGGTSGTATSSGAPSGTPGSGGVLGTQTSKSPAVTVSGPISSKSDVISVPVHCAATSGSCAPATVQLTVVEQLRNGHVTAIAARKKGKTTKQTVVVGSATVTLAAGKSETVKVSLNAAGMKLLAQHSKLAVEVQLVSEHQILKAEGVQISQKSRANRKRR
jgi:PKD domain/Carboxypeptidase regulatory-like domain